MCMLLGMGGEASLSCKVNYRAIRTHRSTLSTRGAFAVINRGKVVLHVNGVIRTILFPQLAGNAGILTYLFGNGTLIQGFAPHVNLLRLRHNADDFSGANHRTPSAARAALLYDLGESVLPHVHSLTFARLHAGAEAEASVVAPHKPAAYQICSAAVFHPVIRKFILDAPGVAHDHGKHALFLFKLYAHDIGNQVGHRGLPYR